MGDGEVVRVIGLTRTNNISIMLKTFSKYPGVDDILAELCAPNSHLTIDNLLTLVQAWDPSTHHTIIQSISSPPLIPTPACNS